jgi:hypothetical protein
MNEFQIDAVNNALDENKLEIEQLRDTVSRQAGTIAHLEQVAYRERRAEAAVVNALRAEIERLRAEAADRTKKVESLWALSDARGAEIECLRVALEEIKHITSHEIRRWDIANEIARAALEPKP